MFRSRWQKLCLITAVALCGGGIGAACLRLYERRACPSSSLRRREYACVRPTGSGSANYDALENDVRVRLAREQGQGKLARAGIYFQRLSDGVAFGINDDATFAPASLLKLPVAFAILLLEEQSPGTLQEKLPYTPERARDLEMMTQIEVSDAGLQRGKTYTVEALLHAVITYSDNLSYYILVAYMNEDPDRAAVLKRTFRELGIKDPGSVAEDAASVREYAGLFRLLYNTSYLDAATSEKLLAWLSESTYDKGIAAGTPSGIAVANKFGERVLPDGTRELHDCGIVYNGDEPYVLCVMTKGRDFAALREVVSDISDTIYSAVTSRAL